MYVSEPNPARRARAEALGVATVLDPTALDVPAFLRDESDGRVVTRLDYSAYESMAKREMEKIADEIERELEGTRVAAIHRVGSLTVGDLAIVCAASAPHRGEAFRACRLLIDRIKERVPVWKREYGPDGAAWVGWVDARCSPEHGHHHHDHEHDHR